MSANRSGDSVQPLVLDGGLGTLLQSRGAFVQGDPLWSARCLASPNESTGRQMLKQAHLDYLAAGADVIKTDSYQMSVGHLQKNLPHLSTGECLEMIKDSVRIARDACREFWKSASGQGTDRAEPKVAGSIGPYGACLANMSEYTGAYVDSMTAKELMDWHRPRLLALLEAGVDYLAFETFPALSEARAVVQLLKEHSVDVPAWISFSCKDERHLCHGEEFPSAVQELWAVKNGALKAIGINCSNPKQVGPLLASIASQAVPAVVYPNRDDSVKQYPNSYETTRDDHQQLGRLAQQWLMTYPQIFAFGGCCDFHPEDIADLRKAVTSTGPFCF